LKEATRVAVIYSLVALAAVFAMAPAIIREFTRRTCPGYARNSCISNLKQIEGAKNIWQLENEKTTNDVPADSDIFGTNLFIRTKPTCTAGGAYTLGRVCDRPKCSIADHNAW
jgi:hypothetical protein